MSSCLIDVAQFVYVSGIHMNDSPDIFADNVLEENAVNLFLAKAELVVLYHGSPSRMDNPII